MINAESTNYTNLKQIVTNRLYRSLKCFDKLSHKIQKLECDLHFLKTCETQNIIPNFIKRGLNAFRHLNTRGHQFEILQQEIKLKFQEIRKFKQILSTNFNILFKSFISTNKLGLLSQWLKYLNRSLSHFQQKIETTHHQKLNSLGIIFRENQRTLVYNLSSKKVEPEVVKILENGPHFSFKPKKFSEIRDKIELENLIGNLKFTYSNIITEHKFNELTKEIRTISESYFRDQQIVFNKIKVDKTFLKIKQFLRKNDTLLLKSDKGNSLVLVDTPNYFSFGHNFF